MTDRPYVARELVPYGTPPSADLLNAFDNQLQTGTLDPASIAPIARLMSVGDIVLRSDLEVDRYDIARPRPTWQLLTAPLPSGPRYCGQSAALTVNRPAAKAKRAAPNTACRREREHRGG